MDLRNRIRVVGNVGTAPQLRYNTAGSPVTNFRLAVDESKPTDQEEQTRLWFTVELWGRQAERACELVTKGASVTVEGKLRVDEWIEEREGGRHRFNLIVANADFIVHRDAAGRNGSTEPPA